MLVRFIIGRNGGETVAVEATRLVRVRGRDVPASSVGAREYAILMVDGELHAGLRPAADVERQLRVERAAAGRGFGERVNRRGAKIAPSADNELGIERTPETPKGRVRIVINGGVATVTDSFAPTTALANIVGRFAGVLEAGADVQMVAASLAAYGFAVEVVR
jgi:hypothetical protein